MSLVTDFQPGSPPLPDPLNLPSPVLGRGRELRLLAAARARVEASRRPELLLLTGPAGIGKTALAGVFARDAHDDGSVVLYGRCDPSLGTPYQPWIEALGHLVAHAPPQLIATAVALGGGDLTHLVPTVGARPEGAGSSDAETARYLLFATVLGLLAAAAPTAPLVLVIDDLHQADLCTVKLLRHLVASSQILPVLVVATLEEPAGGPGPLSEPLAHWPRRPGPGTITLAGLSTSEVAELIASTTGRALAPSCLSLPGRLGRASAGNPLFVAELVAHLVDTGVLGPSADGRLLLSGESTDGGLPATVEQALTQRLATLGEPALSALSVAAVMGADVDVAGVASAAEMATELVLDALRAAVAARFLLPVSDRRFRFSHSSVRAVLSSRLGQRRLRDVHRRVAEFLERRSWSDPDRFPGQLAYHWGRVVAGAGSPPSAATSTADRAKAGAWARAAGLWAQSHLAPAEAVRCFEQALGLLEGHDHNAPRLRARLLADLGEAQRQSGRPEFAATLLQAGTLADQIRDDDALIGAGLAFRSASFSVVPERLTLLESALVAVGPPDTEPRARLLSLLALDPTLDTDYHRRRAAADEALAIARRLGDPTTILDVALRRLIAISVPETLAERLTESSEAEALAEKLGDPTGLFWSAVVRIRACLQAADLAEYRRCLDKATTVAARIGSPTLRYRSKIFEARRRLLAGDTEGAEVLAVEARQLGTDTGQVDALLIYGTVLIPLRWHQGALEGLHREPDPKGPRRAGLGLVRAGMARRYADAGRRQHAQALLDDDRATGFALAHDDLLMVGLTAWSEAAARLGDRPAAEVLYQRLAPWGDQLAVGGGIVCGAVAHQLGSLATVLGRYQQAADHFEAALGIHERIEAPFHIARTRLEWGRMLRDRGRGDDQQAATAHLSAARDLASRYGCLLVERRAADLLGAG